MQAPDMQFILSTTYCATIAAHRQHITGEKPPEFAA
jgi:hypothetical protein